MQHDKSIIALDVSKARLDGFDTKTGEVFQVDNTKEGRAKSIASWRKRERVLVVLEASGGYERPMIDDLVKAGIAVRLTDPRRVRHYARALGRHAKNDRIDAEVIAAFAQATPCALYEDNPEQRQLAELATYRRQLLEAQNAAANQAEMLTDPGLRRMTKRRLNRLKAEIAVLDKRIAEHTKASPELQEKAKILRSIPGVGPVLTTALLAFMPELGTLTRRQAAALAGVAPMDNESGKRKRPRSIYGGRPAVRNVLYMAAVVACRHNPPLKRFFNTLKNNGKKFKVACVAVMRKLIILANTLLRENRLYKA